MRTLRMRAAVTAVCIATLLFPGTLTASSGMQQQDQASSNTQGGPISVTAPSGQDAAQQQSTQPQRVRNHRKALTKSVP
jgi:hypothetical protein